MSVRIYNTETQKKENFVPLTPGEVKMYVCGPTVYDYLHIGNFRGAIFFNLVRNWLVKSGFKVTYVYNFTDVDDKIIKRANEEGVSTVDISEKYIEAFKQDYSQLKLGVHDHNPKVTEFIPQIVELIEKLIENKKAYVVDGEVLYAVNSFEGYGKLSHKNIDELQAGARVEVEEKKKNPLDFSLWKPAKPGEPKWPSPWSDGRPGWHIECSAMATCLLGESIDIHGGGIDLIFPHHENEIAQTEGATEKPFVKYWMHNNFINMGSEKMSKSLGNIQTGHGFLEKYNGEIFKYMILSAHYRSQNDFSQTQVDNTIAGLARIYSALNKAEEVVKTEVAQVTVDKEFQSTLDQSTQGVEQAFNDDFNTPEVFARIFEVVRNFNSAYKPGQKVTAPIKAKANAFIQWVHDTGHPMSLFEEPAGEYLRILDDMLLEQKQIVRADVDELVVERGRARSEKDFARADEVRDKLKELGIAVHDTPTGTHWEVEK